LNPGVTPETGTNRIVIEGRVVARDAMRYTPAGIPIVEMTLSHQSTQSEAGHSRQVDCEVRAVAAGDAARKVAHLAPGSRVRADGFIAHPGKSRSRLVLHINEIEFI
jgi:primosomal replication protein N